MMAQDEASAHAAKIWGDRVERIEHHGSRRYWSVELKGDRRNHSFDDFGHPTCHTECIRSEKATP